MYGLREITISNNIANPMRLLFVTNGIPLPPCGGHLLRAYHQMRLLAAQHQVDLIALADSTRRNATGTYNIEDYKVRLNEYCTEVDLIPASKSTRITKLINYASIYPSGAVQIIKSALPEAVNKKLQVTHYDAVIFLLADVGISLPKHYAGLKILDMIDLFSVSFKYYSQTAKGRFEKLRRGLDSLRYTYFERSVSKNFDKVLVVAKADIVQYAQVANLLHADIDWVPHGIAVEEFVRPSKQPPPANEILITGDLSHPANVEGVKYFCSEVLPIVLQQLPDAKLTIVGSKPKASILALASDTVKIISNVPDMKPYLYGAKVSFCGVKLRMGTQTKILEAMAAGLPVVSTTAGNNGIEGTNGHHLFFSDNPAELAQSIVQLCTDDTLWQTLSANARAYVTTQFSSEQCVSRLNSIINQSIAKRQKTPIG